MPPLTLTTDPATSLIPTHLHAPLLDLLQDATLTFRDIAHQLGLAPGALLIFLASDDGAHLLETIERANTLRARVAAAASLPLVATVLNRILEDFLNSTDPVLSDDAPEEARLRAARARESQRVNARRTAHTLLRLLAPPPRRRATRNDAPPPRTTDPEQPTPRETPMAQPRSPGTDARAAHHALRLAQASATPDERTQDRGTTSAAYANTCERMPPHEPIREIKASSPTPHLKFAIPPAPDPP